MEPSDQPVTLKGVIREIHGYGPPGYGENKKADVPVTYWVIEVSKPIDIPCTPEKPEWKSIDCKASKRLRLFFFSSSKDELEVKAKKMRGRKVVVTGTLERQTTAGEFTPVIVSVTAIEPISHRSAAI